MLGSTTARTELLEPLGGFGFVRWLTPLAGLVGMAALLAGSHPRTSLLAVGVVVLALALELAGWRRSVRSDGRRLALAAVAGALTMAALLGWVQWKRVGGLPSSPDKVASASR